jgi:geranylgeranyl diphosphate synthase type II
LDQRLDISILCRMLQRTFVDDGLSAALDLFVRTPGCSPTLKEAMNYALFPGGGRMRPLLLTTVAEVLGATDLELVQAAAASLELLHSASLVHDDLPCFDDAAWRRGRRSLHTVYGEPLAVLVGDGLIALAFRILAQNITPRRAAVLAEVGQVASTMVCGQAQESESQVALSTYHHCKTGCLFESAAVCGALAAGAPPEPWRLFGRRIGAIYQLADDVFDVVGSGQDVSKPTGRDALLGRPNYALAHGTQAAWAALDERFGELRSSLPSHSAMAPFHHWLDILERHVRGAIVMPQAREQYVSERTPARAQAPKPCALG